MPSIDEVCLAAADAIANGVTGLRVKGYVDDITNPPEAQIYTRPYDPRFTLGGSPKRVYELSVRIWVPRTNPRTAQQALRDFMESTGANSVPAAIEDSDNWDAAVDDAEVVNIGQPFEAELEAQPNVLSRYWAVDIDFNVIW